MSKSPRKGEGKGKQTQTPTVEACPECDSSEIDRRWWNGSGWTETRAPECEWRCTDCDAYFAAPVERPKRKGIPPESITAKLLRADPSTPWDAIRGEGQEGDGE